MSLPQYQVISSHQKIINYLLYLENHLGHVLFISSLDFFHIIAYPRFHVFITNLDKIEIPKNNYEALKVSKCREVMEEMKILENET